MYLSVQDDNCNLVSIKETASFDRWGYSLMEAPSLRLLSRAVHLKLLPRKDIKFHYSRPRAETKTHFNGPRAYRMNEL